MPSFSSYCVKKLSDYLHPSESPSMTGFTRRKNSESLLQSFSQHHRCCFEKRPSVEIDFDNNITYNNDNETENISFCDNQNGFEMAEVI